MNKAVLVKCNSINGNAPAVLSVNVSVLIHFCFISGALLHKNIFLFLQGV